MASEWLVLQINDSVDNPGYGDIKVAIMSVFGDKADYFIPMYHEKMGSYTSTCTLMQGYVFVKDCQSARDAIGAVHDHRMFSGVLMNGRKVQTIPASDIAQLRRKLRNSLKKKYPVGTPVRICEGPLKDLVGTTAGVEEGGLVVIVKISRHSRDILAPVPATLIERVSEDSEKQYA